MRRQTSLLVKGEEKMEAEIVSHPAPNSSRLMFVAVPMASGVQQPGFLNEKGEVVETLSDIDMFYTSELAESHFVKLGFKVQIRMPKLVG